MLTTLWLLLSLWKFVIASVQAARLSQPGSRAFVFHQFPSLFPLPDVVVEVE